MRTLTRTDGRRVLFGQTEESSGYRWPMLGAPVKFGGGIDCDFNNGLGPWTVVNGTVGTVDLHDTTTSVAKYDLTSVPGCLLVQVGHGTTVNIRADYTLADGESAIIPFFNGGPAGGDNMVIALRLNESSDAGSTTGAFLACMVEQDTTTWEFQGNSDADATGLTLNQNLRGHGALLRIARIGTTYACWVSYSGGAWYYLYRRTSVSTPYANVWIAITGPSASQVYMPIIAIPWTKRGTNALKPW